MASGLFFDIDIQQLRQVGVELGASEKQIRLAVFAAARRTATTLRTLSARGLASELQLRTIGLLRKRLKNMRATADAFSGSSSGMTVALWYGLNDMPVSWFKGRPKETGGGAEARGQQFAGAFVAKSKFKGRRTVFKRDPGAARLHIQERNLQVESQAAEFIEDKIFAQVDAIFWKNFRRDLAARVKYQLGEA